MIFDSDFLPYSAEEQLAEAHWQRFLEHNLLLCMVSLAAAVSAVVTLAAVLSQVLR